MEQDDGRDEKSPDQQLGPVGPELRGEKSEGGSRGIDRRGEKNGDEDVEPVEKSLESSW